MNSIFIVPFCSIIKHIGHLYFLQMSFALTVLQLDEGILLIMQYHIAGIFRGVIFS